MATTHFKFKKFNLVDTPTINGVVKMLKTEYGVNQRDEDKSGDVEDAAYYQGRKDAISDVLYSLGWKVK